MVSTSEPRIAKCCLLLLSRTKASSLRSRMVWRQTERLSRLKRTAWFQCFNRFSIVQVSSISYKQNLNWVQLQILCNFKVVKITQVRLKQKKRVNQSSFRLQILLIFYYLLIIWHPPLTDWWSVEKRLFKIQGH